ncbi:(2Fe-2S)-binding protein [Bordetella petrii]|uniref:(2Fe-2S)-binding protein n=1 Tax=Bordetella petrii TaxID=94624 RepID=UPI001E574FB4|nr:(2Fe-2S)-binding protein [Bordetella petrii]MCD0504467.1 (2Fe-2S)-binding protein [Bordetella petrii]
MNRIAVKLNVNGRPCELQAEPNATLADSLREQAGTNSVHLGCEHGVCGACNVYLNGEVVRACLTLTAPCDGMEVVTLEGLDDATATALKDAMHRHHGLQCGFCTPGMLITGHDMLVRGLCGSETEIRQQLCGNICRCTGYQGIVAAIAETREETAP